MYPRPMPIRIAVIANKTWECDPLVSALLAKDARPPQLGNILRGYEHAVPSRP